MVNGVSLSDRGFYHCTATNAQGTVTSSTATLGINGTHQIVVPVLLTDQNSGPFQGLENLSGGLSLEMRDAINQFVEDLNNQADGREVNGDDSSSILLYSVQPLDDPVTLMPIE